MTTNTNINRVYLESTHLILNHQFKEGYCREEGDKHPLSEKRLIS